MMTARKTGNAKLDDIARTDADGSWRRTESLHRNWITPDGAPGPTGQGGFAAEPGRYHLYVAWNCPWAHRTLIMRVLKRLEAIVSVSYVAPRRGPRGWMFDPARGFVDELHGVEALVDIYLMSDPYYDGRITVPVLWDRQTGRVVNNESSEIIRMFNDAFTGIAPASADYYPDSLRPAIDAWNDRIYHGLNNGVYRAGFASSQAAYEEAAHGVFDTLDAIENTLDATPYLAGDVGTEADWRLFPTLARFDVAYFNAFKCNLRRLADYPRLWAYARRLFHVPGIAETVRFETYKHGYHSPSATRNPHGIVPMGPIIDWNSSD